MARKHKKQPHNTSRMTVRNDVAAKIAHASGTVTHEDVALRAFQIYLAEGRPDGRHVEHWLAAEEQLRA